MKVFRTLNSWKYLSVAGILMAGMEANAQELPATQVWLCKIDHGIPKEIIRISAVDRYNNQPMFSPDGKFIYFTAEQESGQTDIAEYEIISEHLRLINSSAESEYSPTPIPGQEAVSVIRVEPPEQLQRLWSISTSGGESSLLMPNVEPVGYYTWMGPESVAVFILGESFSLHKAVVGDQPSEFLVDNIGRTLRLHPVTGEILFVDKTVAPWSITSIDIESGTQTKVMSLFPGIEDFEVDHAGRYWMGSGSKIYRSNEANTRWELTVDFQAFGIDNITRLTSSADGNFLAIVAGR